MTRKPLAGIKVVDFSAVYAGPICARLLGDCGADVVKIETLLGGDVVRGPHGYSRVFAHFNAGKKSIAMDLKKPDAQRVARDLLEDADILIENFRPGVMQAFHLDYASLRDEFPRLVYCSISGFGQHGPFAGRAAYAPIAHAASGFEDAYIRAQRVPPDRPPDSGIMIADMLTGSYAYGAIQTALLARASTGAGDYVDVTMMESMMMLIPRQIQAAQSEALRQDGGFQPVRVKDGYVMICIVSEKNMRELALAIGRPDLLTDERFAERLERYRNMDEFVREIERWSMPLTAQACEQKLNAAGVPCSAYNTAKDLLDHPQTMARGSFTRLEDSEGDFLVQNAPFQFANGAISASTEVPGLGQHTVEILSDRLGYSADEVERLLAARVVYGPA